MYQYTPVSIQSDTGRAEPLTKIVVFVKSTDSVTWHPTDTL